ncbi:hypothetical protein AMS68_002453 [Peltaster fructicola]|uniref:Ribosomal protein S36, mitochondrial n=1 Tax=Peltaster fructicola TaxID=286661 RepID=A0A6H0XQH0_9PEZI|nr:hypothetical protein AMS68_002453 [Peltaster fructicola]
MQSTRALFQARQPLIKFLGRRTIPQKIDHAPHAHPAAPTDSLPESFASYRSKAQQHGPLNGGQTRSFTQPSSGPLAVHPHGAIGGHSGRDLGSVKPKQGEFWDRSELPSRFGRLVFSDAEIEAIESGGASLIG